VSSYWFAVAPAPGVENLNAACEYRIVAGEAIWAVLQQPVEPQQLRRAIEWELMPETLLRNLESALSGAIGPALPTLLVGVDLDLPLDVQGYVLQGRVGHVMVAGTLLLAYRMTFGSTYAEVTVAEGRWLLAVHPAHEASELIEWRTTDRE
jgi:hypothetical protein